MTSPLELIILVTLIADGDRWISLTNNALTVRFCCKFN